MGDSIIGRLPSVEFRSPNFQIPRNPSTACQALPARYTSGMPTRIRYTRITSHAQSLAREMEKLQFSSYAGSGGAWTPNVDVFRCRDRFEILVELAGVGRESVELSVSPRAILIEGARTRLASRADSERCEILAMEIQSGPFRRQINFPRPVDPERVSASQNKGLLRIRLPLANPEPPS